MTTSQLYLLYKVYKEMIIIANCILSRSHFKILKINNNNFIVQNTDREFQNGHTHVYSYSIAKFIIRCCMRGEIPYGRRLNKDKRTIESIIRVCDDKYKNKFSIILEKIKEK